MISNINIFYHLLRSRNVFLFHSMKALRKKSHIFYLCFPKLTDPDLPVSVQESLAETWVGGALLQGQGH